MLCRTRVERVAAAAKHPHLRSRCGIGRDMTWAVSLAIFCNSCALKRATALLCDV